MKDDEKIGIVFPVYFYGLPTVVAEFIDKLTIESSLDTFIYTVITCAGSIGNADKTLEKLLGKKNLELKSSFSVTMPNNYNIMSDLPDKEQQNLILQNAEKEIEKIAKLIKTNTTGNFAKHGHFSIFTPIVYRIYGIYRSTKNFYTTQNCNNCGSCASMCPQK